jgi:hypothetical protein
MTTRKNIESTLWKACDSFRGKIDSSRYKDYILSMLFVKYLSDLNKERRAEYNIRFKGDQQRVDRAMKREPFVLDENHRLIISTKTTQIHESDKKSMSRYLLLRSATDQSYGMYSVLSTSTLPLILANRAKRTQYLKIYWRISTDSIFLRLSLIRRT